MSPRSRALAFVLFPPLAAVASPLAPRATAQEPLDRATVSRIREEGLERSRALELYRVLTDRIGARLTGSPAHVEAATWARDRFAEWGLAGARLESFDFGRG